MLLEIKINIIVGGLLWWENLMSMSSKDESNMIS